jgi:hypothetical protein
VVPRLASERGNLARFRDWQVSGSSFAFLDASAHKFRRPKGASSSDGLDHRSHVKLLGREAKSPYSVLLQPIVSPGVGLIILNRTVDFYAQSIARGVEIENVRANR